MVLLEVILLLVEILIDGMLISPYKSIPFLFLTLILVMYYIILPIL